MFTKILHRPALAIVLVMDGEPDRVAPWGAGGMVWALVPAA